MKTQLDDNNFQVCAEQGRGRELGFSTSNVTTLQKAIKIAGTKTEHIAHFTKGFIIGRNARVSNANKDAPEYPYRLMKDGSIKSK
jgi:hypothetical protein|tara:strand:- start:200 stop:454 length:255 start_codon:yes stop_codon:yes gene_type:complete